MDEVEMGRSTEDAIRELYEEDKKVMMIDIIYGPGKRNKEKSISIGNKIMKAFKDEELVFPYIRMVPIAKYNLRAQMKKMNEVKDLSNFVALECELGRPKYEVIHEELSSVYAIEAIEERLGRIKGFIEKLGDDLEDEF